MDPFSSKMNFQLKAPSLSLEKKKNEGLSLEKKKNELFSKQDLTLEVDSALVSTANPGVMDPYLLYSSPFRSSLGLSKMDNPDASTSEEVSQTSGTFGAPSPVLSDSAMIQSIINYLQTAQKKFKENIENKINDKKQEMEEIEKKELKKKMERKLESINALVAKARRLEFSNRADNIGPKIQLLLSKARQLSEISESLDKAGPQEIDGFLSKAEHLNDSIEEDLNEIIQLIRARREFAVLFGSDPINDISEDINDIFDELREAASGGKLTKAKLLEVFKKYGYKDIKFNDKSFSYMFTGKEDEWFVEEAVQSESQYLNAVHNMFLSIEIDAGYEVDVWRKSENMSEYEVRSRSQICQRLAQGFKEFAAEDKFFSIDFKANSRIVKNITIEYLMNRYRSKNANATTDELAAEKERLHNPKTNLLEEFNKSYPKGLKDILVDVKKDGLIDEKWEVFVKRMLEKIRSSIHPDVKLEYQNREQAEIFAKLITTVQNSLEENVAKSYKQEVLDVVFYGRKNVFDWERVLEGRVKETLAVPVAAMNQESQSAVPMGAAE